MFWLKPLTPPEKESPQVRSIAVSQVRGAMDPRPRLARWHHGNSRGGRGWSRATSSSQTPSTISSPLPSSVVAPAGCLPVGDILAWHQGERLPEGDVHCLETTPARAGGRGRQAPLDAGVVPAGLFTSACRVKAATSTSSSSRAPMGSGESHDSRDWVASNARPIGLPARPVHHMAEQLAMGLSTPPALQEHSCDLARPDAWMLASDTSQAKFTIWWLALVWPFPQRPLPQVGGGDT